MPESNLFFQPLRCNIAVILLTDLIVDHGVKVEWSAYIHLLLHAIFIGILLLTFYTVYCIYLHTGRQILFCFLIWVLFIGNVQFATSSESLYCA